MIREETGRLVVEGDMNLGSAKTLLEAGNQALVKLAEGGKPVFDLAAVTEVDSAGLAVVFGWLRASKARNQTLQLINPPQGLLSMADVYGVSDLLPLA
ncbi:hypothetical protein DLREEDagrD3_22900 [Denitratisoma sp. agr-D3]